MKPTIQPGKQKEPNLKRFAFLKRESAKKAKHTMQYESLMKHELKKFEAYYFNEYETCVAQEQIFASDIRQARAKAEKHDSNKRSDVEYFTVEKL